MTITPIAVVIVEAVLKEAPITVYKVMGIILAFIGALLIIAPGKDLHFNKETILGDFFVFANAVSYSIYLVKIKPFVRKYHPITINRISFLYGFFMVIPFGFGGFLNVEWHTFDKTIWMSFFYVLIFTTFLAYYLNSWSMLIVNPSVVGVYIYLQPLLTVIIALILGTDKPEINIVISAILIFIGVYLTGFAKNNSNDLV